MKLYSMALRADKIIEVGIKAEIKTGAVLAKNKDEAIGKATGVAKRIFPDIDGWYNQSAIVAEIPQWQLDKLE